MPTSPRKSDLPSKDLYAEALKSIVVTHPQYRSWTVTSLSRTVAVLQDLPREVAKNATEMADDVAHFPEEKIEEALRQATVEAAAPHGWLYAVLERGRRRALVLFRYESPLAGRAA